MATSAFKSTSKRPSTSSSTTRNKQQPRNQQNPTQKVPIRRSRSVTPFSRTHLDSTSEFKNKTDNPLFWVDGSPQSEEDFDGVKVNNVSKIEIPKFIDLNSVNVKGSCSSNGGSESRRGRSVCRGETKVSGIGRSLSRVDTARRRRSSSRGNFANSESEREQNSESRNFRSESKISSAHSAFLEGRKKLARSASDLSEVLKGRNTWSSQHPASETSDDCAISLSGSQIPHWDDVVSTSSISEAEEKTIKPVLEEKATLRNNSDFIHSGIISDIGPDMENSNAVELVRDIREEFVWELEECEERARRLRAELAAEEHREMELNKILDDIVPEPKTPLVQRTRAVRKASHERKKMSRHLEDEALAYFDECVSISTFDDSDFSSLEDLSSNMVSIDGPGRERGGLPGVPSRSSIDCSFGSQDDMQRTLLLQGNEGSNSSAKHSCNNNYVNTSSLNNSSGTKPQFSFTPMPSATNSFKDDISNYVKIFSKVSGNESSNSHTVILNHKNTEDYNCEYPMEKLVLDRVTFRNRIESGSILLCGGGVGVSLAPFSSVLW